MIGMDVPTVPRFLEGDDGDFGDFTSSDLQEIEFQAVAEPLRKYRKVNTMHVYYPVCIGEVINERYLIEHKLGYGGFSTVWMAYDLQNRIDIVLKIMSAGDWADTELHAQDIITQNVHDTSHLVTYLDTFEIAGNVCTHRVLVLPLMGPCISHCIVQEMPMATRMSAARQLLEALENLHKAGIVHRGEYICF